MKSADRIPEEIRAAIQAHSAGPPRPCPAEGQFLDFYAGRLGESESAILRENLAGCPLCLDVAHDAMLFVEAMAEPETRSASSGAVAWATPFRLVQTRWLLVASTILASAICAVLVIRSIGVGEPVATPAKPSLSPPSPPGSAVPAHPFANLEITKAEYVPEPASLDELTWRGDGPAPARDMFAEAMVPYEKGDIEEGARRLSSYLKEHPDDPNACFYHGVSLLLLEQSAEAIHPLERAISGGRGPLVDDARWYLALAHLKVGGFQEALAQLGYLTDRHRHHDEAVRLSEEVRRVMRGEPPSDGSRR